MEITKNKQQQLVAYLRELIGAEATNGKLAPSLRVYDYKQNGKLKSIYLDWRTNSEMQRGVFSYTGDFYDWVKESFEIVIILNKDNISDVIQWHPKQADNDKRFIKSYLEEEDNEPIYIIMFDTPNKNRYEDKTD